MKWIGSFKNAFRGLNKALQEEPNFRIHLVALIAVCLFGFYFNIMPWEWCVIILASALVISLELVNTAIENLADLVTREQKPLVGKIKDISAAAVLVSAMAAIVLGLIIFTKYLF